MKNRLFNLLIVVFALGITNVNAQITSGNPNFNKGDIDVNVGIGLLSTFYSSHNTTMPPVSISGEYGITDNISVGAYLGFTSTKEDLYFGDYDDHAKYSFTIIGLRGSYHLTVWDKLDTYAGLMLGYAVASSKISSDNPWLDGYDFAASGTTLSAHIGGRYNFSEKIGAFAELGYGISVLNLGVTMKL